MIITVSEAEIFNKAEIDEFLAEQPGASPYHSISWLHAIQRAYKFEFYYFLAKSDGRITGVLPVCLFWSLPVTRRFCSLPFCDVGGVVADSSEVANKLINYAISKLKKLNLKELEIRQRKNQSVNENELLGRKVSMLLDLPETADLLSKSFKSKLRSQIKKAEKNGLVFEYGNDVESVNDFYYVYSRNMHLLGSPAHSKKWFHALKNEYQDNFLVGKVWFENNIVGSGILLFNGYNVSIPWASTLREYNRLAPNMLLYWNLLRLSCEKGCKVFDFGRSTFGEGTYRFKAQWGAKPVLLDWQHIDNTGKVMEMKNTVSGNGRHMIESVWRRIPLPLTNFIGPRLRRHISL